MAEWLLKRLCATNTSIKWGGWVERYRNFQPSAAKYLIFQWLLVGRGRRGVAASSTTACSSNNCKNMPKGQPIAVPTSAASSRASPKKCSLKTAWKTSLPMSHLGRNQRKRVTSSPSTNTTTSPLPTRSHTNNPKSPRKRRKQWLYGCWFVCSLFVCCETCVVGRVF